MHLQVSSNNLSHSKFKFTITKSNLKKNPKSREKEREDKRRPLFHLFKNPFTNAFSSDLRCF
ncbi:hypothetical protein Hdeb2414_s0021g00572921 [Helianthus debilis subsp. tardiflorus]